MQRLLKVIAGWGVCCVSFAAVGGTWNMVPSVSVTEIYTSNVNLASSSMAEEEFVTQISPELSVTGEGRRMTTDFNYRMQAMYYSGDISREDSVLHQLRSDVNADLVEDWLFVDVDASLTQETIDPAGVRVLDDFSVTNNISDVSRIAVSPYLRHSFGQTVISEVRYTRSRINSESGQVPSSDVDVISLEATLLPRARRLGGQGSYVGQQNNFDTGEYSASKLVEFDVWYAINPTLRLLVDLGWESNELDLSIGTERSEIKDSFWLVGFSWYPRASTSIESKYGERYFGKTYSLRLASTHQGMSANIDYIEDTATVAQLQQDIINNRQDSALSASMSGQGAEGFVQKRLSVDLDIPIGRSSLGVSGFDDQRDFLVTNNIEKSRGGSLAFSHPLTRRSEVVFELSEERQQFLLREQEDEIFRSRVELRVALGRRLTSTYALWNVNSDSTVSENSYSQNNVSVQLRLTL